MKKWIVIAVLVAIAAPVLGARQTVVRTDLLGAGWTKQNSMNTELYQKTDPTETGFTGMDGAVITSGVVPSAKSLSPDKTSGVPSINFLYEANGTDTNGVGFIGPANSTKNILYRISDESPAVGNVFKVDSIATDQTITVGSGSIVADVVTLILAAETGGGGASFVEQADDPTSSSEDGYFYGATTSGDFFYKSSTGLFNITTGTYTADPTTPTLVSLTIPAAGTTVEAVFSETMAVGAGGAGGWTLNNPTVAMTRTGGTGTVEDPVIFSLARTVLSTATENPYASYTQPTNGFESADDGVDLASITNATVTNNSTQTASLTTYYLGFNNANTTTMDTTAPVVALSSTTEIMALKPVTIPAGSTIKNIWVYYKTPDGGVPYEVGVYTYATLGGDGTRVAGASVTPVANTWVESSALTGTTYFANETTVYIETGFDGTASSSPGLGRNSGGSEYTKTYVYGAATVTSPTASAYTYAIILEYEK